MLLEQQYDLKEITKTLKAYRKRATVTQVEVAVDTGYSVEQISTFENGRVRSLFLFMYYCRNFLSDEEILVLLRGKR